MINIYRSPFLLLLFLTAACTGTGNINSADDLGLIARNQSRAPLPINDPLYSSLPAGPVNTDTYPNFGDQPQARIAANSRSQNVALMSQMEALENAQRSGTVSPAVYQQRLLALRRLAAQHSPEMLARIDARTSN
ncbi:hypothetical protein WNY59_07585 [Ahrensia kielensis]|uniref:DUF3035 domain-containing protein n=1 Tax=Ahrensia kielensis TaxID=76980 RepID=A0ABU9T5P2_9HYPH